MPEISAEGIFVLGHSLEEQTGCIISLKEKPTAEQLSVLADLEEQIERVKDPGLSLDTPAGQLPLGIPAACWSTYEITIRPPSPVISTGLSSSSRVTVTIARFTHDSTGQ